MDEDQFELVNQIWKTSARAWGSLRDVEKRSTRGAKEWEKYSAVSDEWKNGYKTMQGVRKSISEGVKAAGKFVDFANSSEKKLEKMGIEEVVAVMKKYDKIIDMADEDIGKFVIWLKKFEKQLTMEVSMPPEMKGFTTAATRYLRDRGVMNKNLQAFQRMARVW